MMSVRPSVGPSLKISVTIEPIGFHILFREFTYWSCGSFRLFSWGVGQPLTPPLEARGEAASVFISS